MTTANGYMVRHTVPGATNKDQALNLFFQSLANANGKRRTPVEELVEVERVVYREGLWTVYYTIPSRLAREIIRGEPDGL